MKRVAEHDSPKARRELYAQLLKSSLLLPKPGEPGDPEVGKPIALKPGEKAEILTASDSAGRPMMLAFTDPAALLAWRPEGSNYIALSTRNAMSLAVAGGMSGAVINPNGPVAGELTRSEMLALAEGGIPEVAADPKAALTSVSLPDGSSGYIGPPTGDLPADARRLLADALRKIQEIDSVYLFETVIGGGERHLAIGIHFGTAPSDEREREIMAGIAKHVGAAIGDNKYLDLIVLDRSDLLEQVRSAGQALLT
jgi:hypothetical protein